MPSHFTRSAGTRTTPFGSITSLLAPGTARDAARNLLQVLVPVPQFGRLVALVQPVSTATRTPITSSFDTFIGRPNAW